jgi:hypothetical protein
MRVIVRATFLFFFLGPLSCHLKAHTTTTTTAAAAAAAAAATACTVSTGSPEKYQNILHEAISWC